MRGPLLISIEDTSFAFGVRRKSEDSMTWESERVLAQSEQRRSRSSSWRQHGCRIWEAVPCWDSSSTPKWSGLQL
jgi:hypothetical protein